MPGTGSMDLRRSLRALRDGEESDVRVNPEAASRMALLYPSPYHVGMSSLGFQQVYRLVNERRGWVAERCFLPDDAAAWQRAGLPLLTLESERAAGDFPVIAASVAYELEIRGLVWALELAGVPPLAEARDEAHPLVVGGGPLTFSNPAPLAPFCDLVLCGEAEETLPSLCDLLEQGGPREVLLRAAADLPGAYVPRLHGGRVPPVARCDDALLPARSGVRTANTELRSMFLVEVVRGCSRGCTYCVMRRSTNGGMRIVDPARILALVPERARRVGLVGASVSDHPHLADVLRPLVDAGREVGISSLRADKLDDEMAALLRRGGYRTLTTASDGASERMRTIIDRRTHEKHLLRAAALAGAHGFDALKLYMMVGLPGETDEDIDDLVRFSRELAALAPRLVYGVAPFVAKRNTPLDGAPWAGIDVVDARLDRLRRGLKGTAEVRPTSSRWAWVEYMLAQAGPEAGLAVLDAHREGGTFAAYRRAFARREVRPERGWNLVPAPRLRRVAGGRDPDHLPSC